MMMDGILSRAPTLLSRTRRDAGGFILRDARKSGLLRMRSWTLMVRSAASPRVPRRGEASPIEPRGQDISSSVNPHARGNANIVLLRRLRALRFPGSGGGFRGLRRQVHGIDHVVEHRLVF